MCNRIENHRWKGGWCGQPGETGCKGQVRLQAKERRGPPAATSSKQRGMQWTAPQSFQKEPTLPTLGTLASRTKRTSFCCLRPPSLFQQSEDTDTPPSLSTSQWQWHPVAASAPPALAPSGSALPSPTPALPCSPSCQVLDGGRQSILGQKPDHCPLKTSLPDTDGGLGKEGPSHQLHRKLLMLWLKPSLPKVTLSRQTQHWHL